MFMNIDTQKAQMSKTSKSSILSKLMRTLSLKEKTEQNIQMDENYDLIYSLKDAKKEWIDANMCFEFADAQEMVDYYTYKIKASQVRYEYFLKAAKEKGIKIETIDEGINPQ